MLGYLLARAGVEVVVLEKHGDFLRDFRGDTIHPSTMEVMHELGLLENFLQRPHNRMYQARVQFGEKLYTVSDFSGLPVKCPYIAFMPQWEFLDFIVNAAKRYPTFKLRMSVEAVERNAAFVHAERADMKGRGLPFIVEEGSVLSAQSSR